MNNKMEGGNTMDKLKTVKIKDKDYVMVNERIKYFRENNDGSILTELVSNVDGACVFKASIIIDGQIKATGYAREKDGDGFINKTSYIENCETSAIGRALGNFGIGIDTSVASYEEVANAVKQQNVPTKTPKITTVQIKKIKELVDDVPAMLTYYKIVKIEDMTGVQADEVINRKNS